MIYLDNAATTKPSKAATEAFLKVVDEFGNPSSLHGLGLRAEHIINDAKDKIAKKLGADKKGIIFTSGGTEANNLAVRGSAMMQKRRGNRIITSKIEHPSVLESVKMLGNEGFDVVFVGTDNDGRVKLDELCELLTENTILVSIMHVNNETGVIQPIKEISDIIKKKVPSCIFHCDCVQSFGKIPVVPSKLGVDLLTISAHKIHGFKGCGALYINRFKPMPIIFGGEQQGGLRPGTENIGGIAAFGAAAETALCDSDKMKHIRSLMIKKLSERIDNIKINGSDEYNSGSVLNVSFLGIKAEILLHSIERHNIYVSTGSACSSHKPQPSHVLTAMGCDTKEITGAVRISFSENTTEEEVIEASEKIAAEVATIRKYMR